MSTTLEKRLNSELSAQTTIVLDGDAQQIAFEEDPAHSQQTTIHWRWTAKGMSWSPQQFSAVVTSDGFPHTVLRFVASGRMGSAFAIVLTDRQGQRVAIPIDSQITTLRTDGQFTEQYVMVELKNLSPTPAFDWNDITHVQFESQSPQGDIRLSEWGLYDLTTWRRRGVAVGVYKGNRERTTPLSNWYGVRPQIIHAFEDLVESPEDSLAKWTDLAAAGHLPMSTFELWIMHGDKSPALLEKEKKAFTEAYGEVAYAWVLQNQRVLRVSALGEQGDSPLLADLCVGKYDPWLRKRAQTIKAFGGPLIERLLHEYTGYWYPWCVATPNDAEHFIEGWKRIHRIYQEEGASNALFCWSPHAKSVLGFREMERHFQHLHRYIDLVALDAYGLPYDCREISEMLTGITRRLAKYHVPMVIGETGATGKPRAEDPQHQEKKKFFNSVDCFLRNVPHVEGVVYFDVTKHELGTPEERWFSPLPDQIESLQRDVFYHRSLDARDIKNTAERQAHAESLSEKKLSLNFNCEKLQEVPQGASSPLPPCQMNDEHIFFRAATADAPQRGQLVVKGKDTHGHLRSLREDKGWEHATFPFLQPLTMQGKALRLIARGRKGNEYVAVHAIPANQGPYAASRKYLIGPLSSEYQTWTVPISPDLAPVTQLGVDFDTQTMINAALNLDGAEIDIQEFVLINA